MNDERTKTAATAALNRYLMQHRLRRMGVDAALEEAGAQDGDEIRIVGRAFTFESASSADPYRELDL